MSAAPPEIQKPRAASGLRFTVFSVLQNQSGFFPLTGACKITGHHQCPGSISLGLQLAAMNRL